MNICIATIVSSNYLAFAKVLAASVAQHASGCSFVTLIVDRKNPAGERAAEELDFPIIWAEDLGLLEFEQLAYKFDILELNTALKPTLLKHLLARGHDAVVYLDPDIKLFAPLRPVFDALENASIVLTPHTMTPILDGQKPSDVEIMRSGVFNLGFMAVRGDGEGLRMLDWWEARCLDLGFNDQQSGIFVDQKWMDLTPAYFNSVYLLKHAGCNVAYWNLHERTVTRDSVGQVFISDVPLIFFHFSGVDAMNPTRLSKHQNRHDMPAGSVLASLVEQYTSALLAAGHANFLKMAYTFSKLSDGTPISPVMRRAILVYQKGETQPFDAQSAFQLSLSQFGLRGKSATGGGASRFSKTTSMNFDPNDPVVRLVNGAIRLAARLLGLNRLQLLLRYFSLLGRGSNLAAVLTHAEFQRDPRMPTDGKARTRPLPDAKQKVKATG